jgi:hypothetical protein
MELLGDEAIVDAHIILFGDNVILMQDRYTVCVECATSSKIVLDAPVETPS